jgi:hypothetical protein
MTYTRKAVSKKRGKDPEKNIENKKIQTINSVADPGCLSWIPDPDFHPSRTLDPGSKNSNKRKE